MNFFGHAHLARERDTSSAFVLGSMLPDFSSMSRARLLPIEHAGVRSGVAFHHTTDDAFHRAPSFVALMAQAFEQLEATGVAHGPSRAVSHVGVELLLDGVLLDDDLSRRAYLDAIGEAAPAQLGPALRFRHPERFVALHERLTRYGLPTGYRDVEFVADRLYGILAPRPRLALAPEDRGPVTDALRAVARSLDAGLLLAETRSAIADGEARAKA